MPRAAVERGRRPVVEVLRIGHRLGRDPRLTTHLALTARAFGAERLFLQPPDPALAERVGAITRRWGGRFAIEGMREWKPVVRRPGSCVVHLTMYGEPLRKLEARLRREPRVLVVVGGAKVPSELYGMADLNIAVGHQPHSEVAALAIMLDRLRGVPGPGGWPGAEQVIVPSARGKKVVPGSEAAP
jgi:tRNA (cytidine56-2'-O)-methyltransferase